jgi:uncharacterized protein (DUF1800 family)
VTVATASPPARAADPWAPYQPGQDGPWDLARAVHLHRCAGLGATWAEVQRDLADGPRASVGRLLLGKSRLGGVPADFEAVARALEENADDPTRLRAWWAYRLAFGPDPLTERLTLMWHNHFATSIDKVGRAGLMLRQNHAFRRLARAPFTRLADAALREPALLVWLDAAANRKGRPNENLARELMELFTLGVGNYSEKDVKEAARALTGWTVAEGAFRSDGALHDCGVKTILGRTGRWTGSDLVRMALGHPATARRLAWRVCHEFLGEGAAGLEALAGGLRRRDLDVGWAVATLLRSRAFFAGANLGRRVVGPVEFVAGAVRALEMFDPPPSTVLLADWAARLGQDLFRPPNVGGWPGGRHWLSARTLIGRANFAADLVLGRLSTPPAPLDAVALARKHGRGGGLGELARFYADLLLGGVPSEGWLKRLLAGLGGKPSLTPDTACRVVILTLSSPEAQLA